MSGLLPPTTTTTTATTTTNATTGNVTCHSPYDAPIFSAVAAVAAGSGVVSLLACVFVVGLLLLFKKWRFFTQRLLLYLALAAALKATATILQRVDYRRDDTSDTAATATAYRNFCVFSGFLSQVTAWIFFMAVIVVIVSLLVTSFALRPPERFERLFLLLIFVLPLTFNLLPFVQRSYGRAGPWCWIRSREEEVGLGVCRAHRFGQILQLALFYVPVHAIVLVLGVAYVVVVVKYWRHRRRWRGGRFDPEAERLREVMNREILPLIFLPLIFLLLFLPQFVTRVYDFVNPDRPQPALWFVSALLFPLEGGGVALVIALDPNTRRRLLQPSSVRAACRDLLPGRWGWCWWQRRRWGEKEEGGGGGGGVGGAGVVEYPVENVESEARLNEMLLKMEEKERRQVRGGAWSGSGLGTLSR